jgi:hypothetical protein
MNTDEIVLQRIVKIAKIVEEGNTPEFLWGGEATLKQSIRFSDKEEMRWILK